MNKRLTFKLGESNPSYGLEDKASAKPGLFTDYDGFYAFLLATHRLGQYEDIFFDENGNERITPAKVAELAQAKADERLVVLPVSVGDTVYKIVGLSSGEIKIVEGTINDFSRTRTGDEFYFSEPTRHHTIWCDEDNFGKTVFLTREEAEKALKECEAK